MMHMLDATASARLPSLRRAAFVLAVAAGGVLVTLAIASWTGAVGARDQIFLLVFDAARDAGLVDAADVVGDAALLGLGGVAAAVFATRWRHQRRASLRLAVGAAAAVAACGVSELLKLVLQQPRPCHELSAVHVSACPPLDDWSLPSNHATIAVALATALLLTAPRAWVVALPLALAVMVSRVAAGEHYIHDVIDGAALGGLIVLAAVAAVSALRFTTDTETLPELS